MRLSIALLAAAIYSASFCVTDVSAKECSEVFRGGASFYADCFHGRKTASGARLNNNAYTCAHRTLPFGTKVLVENPRNGSTCVVTVTDRGPFHGRRVIDLTKAAAKKLGITGIGKVICSTGNLLGRSTEKVATKLMPDRKNAKVIAATNTTTTVHHTDSNM